MFKVQIWIDCVPYSHDYDITEYFKTFPEMIEFLNNLDVSELVDAKPYTAAEIKCKVIYLGERQDQYQVIATYTVA